MRSGRLSVLPLLPAIQPATPFSAPHEPAYVSPLSPYATKRIVIKPIVLRIPLISRGPRATSGVNSHPNALPFEQDARAPLSVSAVVSAIDEKAVTWMEGALPESSNTKLQMDVSGIVSFLRTTMTSR